MSETERAERTGGHQAPVRAPQNLAGGIALVLLAALSLWLTRNLEPGTLGSMGSGMLPRILSSALGLCGLALVISAFVRDGDRLERLQLRGPLMIILAVIAFAMTIRSVPLGLFNSPELGMAVATPLAIVISGYATPEARFRELVLLALGLTPLCMLLFGDLLNMPIPLFPRTMADWFPAAWSQKAIMRIVAGAMLSFCVLLVATGRGKGDSAGQEGES